MPFSLIAQVQWTLAAHSRPVCAVNMNKANKSGNNHKTQAYLPIWPWDPLMSRLA